MKGLGQRTHQQYDAAVDGSVAKTKMPDSEVAGRATVFIFSELNTGNNTYQARRFSIRPERLPSVRSFKA